RAGLGRRDVCPTFATSLGGADLSSLFPSHFILQPSSLPRSSARTPPSPASTRARRSTGAPRDRWVWLPRGYGRRREEAGTGQGADALRGSAWPHPVMLARFLPARCSTSASRACVAD